MLVSHYANPLHVYCRLRDCGLDLELARATSYLYEVFVYNPYITRCSMSGISIPWWLKVIFFPVFFWVSLVNKIADMRKGGEPS